MKKFFIIAIMFFVYLITPKSHAFVLYETSNMKKVALICDSVSTVSNTSCNVYTEEYLSTLAQNLYFSQPSNPECDLNPNDIGCDSSITDNIATVEFLIIDADSNRAYARRATKNSFGSPLISPTSLTTQDEALKTKVVNYEQSFKIAEKMLTFTQDESEDLINTFGESVYDWISLDGSTQSLEDEPASVNPCQSAISFIYVQACSSLLTDSIDSAMAKHPNMAQFLSFLEGLQTTIGAKGISFGSVFKNEVEATYTYPNDGGKLVLKVKAGLNPSIAVDLGKSRTSSGLLSLFINRAGSDPFIDNYIYSGAEARSLFMSIPDCYTWSTQVGWTHEYMVTRVEQPDGTMKVTAIEYIGSTPIYETQRECVVGGGAPFNP